MGPDRSREIPTFEKPHSRRATLPEEIDEQEGEEEEAEEEARYEARGRIHPLATRRSFKFDM